MMMAMMLNIDFLSLKKVHDDDDAVACNGDGRGDATLPKQPLWGQRLCLEVHEKDRWQNRTMSFKARRRWCNKY